MLDTGRTAAFGNSQNSDSVLRSANSMHKHGEQDCWKDALLSFCLPEATGKISFRK